MNTTPGSTPKPSKGATSRRALVIAAATVAFALVIGLVAAVARPSAEGKPAAQRSTLRSPSPVVSVEPSPTEQPTSEPSEEPKDEPTEEPSQEPTPDPYALADGIYPAFVTGVDVQGATVTLDVIQLFEGTSARRAAIQDGVAREDARYLTIYVRNENDLLRTLPVAENVRIRFMGVCDVPPNRTAALTKLRKETTPYDETFYYAVRVSAGEIGRMVQHLTISAC